MHITLRQLKVLEAVARHLSYTRASEELYLTQPAVSMQIKQLEENAGLPLFEHLGKKIYMTEAGREMFRCSREIARQLAETQGILEEMQGKGRGQLAITMASTANYFAPQLLAAFSRRFKAASIRLGVTNRKGLLQKLELNETDLAIMGEPPPGLDVIAEPFMENPLVVIAGNDHPLVGRSKVRLSELQGETFVVREQDSGTRIAMERFFSGKGMSITTGMEMSSNEAIKQAVQAGLGLGIVSIHTLELELEARRLTVLDVEAFPILRQWYIVHRRGKRLLPVAQAFREFVLKEASGLLPMPLKGAASGR